MRNILDTVLVQLMAGLANAYTIRDSLESSVILGSTGSGKTKISEIFAKAFLSIGMYGMVILCTKADEVELFWRYAIECGRKDDVIEFKPNGAFFDYLGYESEREGSDVEDITELLLTICDLVSEGSSGDEDSYWRNSLRQLIRGCVIMLRCSGSAVSMTNIYRLVVSAPNSKNDLEDKEWQESSYFFKVMDTATDNSDHISPEDVADLNLIVEFFTRDFATLSSKTKSVTTSLLSSSFSPFALGKLRNVFTYHEGRFNANPEKCRDGMILIINMPLLKDMGSGKTANAVMRFCAQRILQRTPIKDSTRVVGIWADECQFYLHSVFDPLHFSVCRSARIANFLIVQSLPVLQMRMGEQPTLALLSNISNKLFLSNSDNSTNAYASNLCGERWMSLSGTNASYNAQGELNSGMNSNQQKIRLVDEIEFTQFRRGNPVVDDGIVSGLFHRIGRPFSTGENFLHVNFK